MRSSTCSSGVPSSASGLPAALAILAEHATDGAEPALVGEVREAPRGGVTLRSISGGERPLDLLSGEQLPRIC